MDELVLKEFLDITDAESLAIKEFKDFTPEKSVVFPLGDLASLGAMFSSLPAAFSAVAQTTGKSKVLYEAIYSTGIGNKLSIKNGITYGNIVNGKGTIVDRVAFKQVGNTAQAASSASMMFMALAIMAVNKALKDISANQKEIINFLEVDKQTQLKGDLIVLSDIIGDYQHNWNNEQYRANREMQVLDIKRSAEQNILFYREMIEKKLGKKTIIHLDTTKVLNDIQTKFRYYKLALYLYAFSSFLDIMLLENFDESYLNSVGEKINNYSAEYDSFYSKSLEDVEKYASSSLQSRALQGIAIAGKFAGKQIGKIPDKDNKLKVDDKLILGSDRLGKFNEESIGKTVDSFSSVEDSGIKMFVEKIELLNKMHNKPLRLVFDRENIYLSA